MSVCPVDWKGLEEAKKTEERILIYLPNEKAARRYGIGFYDANCFDSWIYDGFRTDFSYGFWCEIPIDGWKKIKTAPKTGESVLLLFENMKKESVQVGYWDEKAFKPNWRAGGFTRYIQPKKWRPLPDPPSDGIV